MFKRSFSFLLTVGMLFGIATQVSAAEKSMWRSTGDGIYRLRSLRYGVPVALVAMISSLEEGTAVGQTMIKSGVALSVLAVLETLIPKNEKKKIENKGTVTASLLYAIIAVMVIVGVEAGLYALSKHFNLSIPFMRGPKLLSSEQITRVSLISLLVLLNMELKLSHNAMRMVGLKG